jgi:hypothetical protein
MCRWRRESVLCTNRLAFLVIYRLCRLKTLNVDIVQTKNPIFSLSSFRLFCCGYVYMTSDLGWGVEATWLGLAEERQQNLGESGGDFVNKRIPRGRMFRGELI